MPSGTDRVLLEISIPIARPAYDTRMGQDAFINDEVFQLGEELLTNPALSLEKGEFTLGGTDLVAVERWDTPKLAKPVDPV
jgi:hypothetical protein